MRAALADRSTRIRLLAWSYLDAVEAGGGGAEENVSTGGTESRAPSRNHELWHQGSYRDMEKALEDLPGWVKLRFQVFYIRASGPFQHEHKPHPVLGRVARLMPREVFVPAEISRAAGFLRAEAMRCCGCSAKRPCPECSAHRHDARRASREAADFPSGEAKTYSR